MKDKLLRRAMQPTDGASLAVFRILLGGLLSWEAIRYLISPTNRIVRYFVEPKIFFNYPGFEWVSALPEIGMKFLFLGMLVLAFKFCFHFGIIFLIVMLHGQKKGTSFLGE
jgi:vitamin K-dependent gamma-carboxylase